VLASCTCDTLYSEYLIQIARNVQSNVQVVETAVSVLQRNRISRASQLGVSSAEAEAEAAGAGAGEARAGESKEKKEKREGRESRENLPTRDHDKITLQDPPR